MFVLTLVIIALAQGGLGNEQSSSCKSLSASELDRLANLESLVMRQSMVIEALGVQVQDKNEEISSLKDDIGRLERKTELDISEAAVGSLSTSHVLKAFRAFRAAPTINVCFSAYLDHDVFHLKINDILPFNRVILNDGGGFNTTMGVFIAPVTGVYMFTYAIDTFVSAYQLVVRLVVNNINVSDGTSDPFHAGQEIQGGNTVFVKMDQVSAAWLQVYNTNNTAADGREQYRFTTFSGCLMYQ